MDVGVGCFGPLVGKGGRSQLKLYRCLFKCLTMRVIQIEELDSLEADINAFVRFFARRGVPQKVRSDNSANFIKGEIELPEAMWKWKDESKAKVIFCRKISRGSLIPGELPIWEGYGKDRS